MIREFDDELMHSAPGAHRLGVLRRDALSQPRLAISVIVPSRGRPALLGACLSALADQRFDRDLYEVIVVVDGIGRPAPEVVAQLGARLQLTILEQAQAGPAAARNLGATHARGTLLAFTDDDCRPDPEWLSQMHVAATRHPGCALGGCTRNALHGNVVTHASQLLRDYVLLHANRNPDEATFFPSDNLAVPTDLFGVAGGFSAAYTLAAGEDRDFCRRWRALGARLMEVPRALVWHDHRLTLLGFWRQQYHYGQGARRFHRSSPQDAASGHLSGADFYVGLLKYPLGIASGRRRVALLGLFALSQAAVTVGYLREAFRRTRTPAGRDRTGQQIVPEDPRHPAAG